MGVRVRAGWTRAAVLGGGREAWEGVGGEILGVDAVGRVGGKEVDRRILVRGELLLKHGEEVIVSDVSKVLVGPEMIHGGGIHGECRGG
jgi:hypothetical protein